MSQAGSASRPWALSTSFHTCDPQIFMNIPEGEAPVTSVSAPREELLASAASQMGRGSPPREPALALLCSGDTTGPTIS